MGLELEFPQNWWELRTLEIPHMTTLAPVSPAPDDPELQITVWSRVDTARLSSRDRGLADARLIAAPAPRLGDHEWAVPLPLA